MTSAKGNYNKEEERSEINKLKKILEAAVDSSIPEQLLAAVKAARKLFSAENFISSDFILSNILAILVDCLKQHDQTMLQFEAAWALTNFAAGSSEQTKQVVLAGAVPQFFELLSSPALYNCEQAVCALGYIICDGLELRDFVIKHGVIQQLLAILQRDVPLSILHNVSWVIASLCRRKDPPTAAILPALNILIHHSDNNILSDTVWGISYLTDNGKEHIQIIIESGIIAKLITLLGHYEIRIQLAALRAVDNIASASDEYVAVLRYYNVTAFHPAFLQKIKQMHKRTFDFSSHRTEDNQTQLVAGTNSNCNSDQRWGLVIECIIPPFCDLLYCQDNQVGHVVSAGLNNLLKMAGSHIESYYCTNLF